MYADVQQMYRKGFDTRSVRIWHKHYKERTHKCRINHELAVYILKIVI